MEFISRLLCAVLALGSHASGHALKSSRGDVVIAANTLPPPSQDPFYTPPTGFEKMKPGHILRHRLAPNPLATVFGQPSNVKATYQLMYRSTDSEGRPEAAVTLVIVPTNANFGKLLSYQTAYDSAYNDCSPSYQLLQGAESNTTGSRDELLLMARALKMGWVVNTPDYEGLHAAYVSGPQAGYATLDSIRAALRSTRITGIKANAIYAMWGYSGGSLASEWAAEIQPSYAPELVFQGAALGGLTPNVTSVFNAINGHPDAGLAPAGIIGLSKAYANLSTYLDKHLVPSTAATFRMAGHQCFTQDATQFANQNISKYFNNGQAAFNEPVPASIISIAGIMGKRGVPRMPLYVYKAVHDEVSPIEDTADLVHEYCAKGARIQYVRISKGNHEQGALRGLGGAVAFLTAVMDGVKASPKCNVTTV